MNSRDTKIGTKLRAVKTNLHAIDWRIDDALRDCLAKKLTPSNYADLLEASVYAKEILEILELLRVQVKKEVSKLYLKRKK